MRRKKFYWFSHSSLFNAPSSLFFFAETVQRVQNFDCRPDRSQSRILVGNLRSARIPTTRTCRVCIKCRAVQARAAVDLIRAHVGRLVRGRFRMPAVPRSPHRVLVRNVVDLGRTWRGQEYVSFSCNYETRARSPRLATPHFRPLLPPSENAHRRNYDLELFNYNGWPPSPLVRSQMFPVARAIREIINSRRFAKIACCNSARRGTARRFSSSRASVCFQKLR